MALYSSYDKYVKKLKKSNEPADYSEYMRAELSDDKRGYVTALLRAKEEAVRSMPTYGKTAERLGGQGLTTGGYAEYLSELSKSGYKNAVGLAEKTYVSAESEARGSYADYIKKYTEGQEKLFGSVVAQMTDASLTDYDGMLEFAADAGLSGEYAIRAADAAREAVTAKLKQTVMDAISKEHLSGKESYEYALKLGLSPELAAELSEYAKKMNEINLSGSYLEGLKK